MTFLSFGQLLKALVAMLFTLEPMVTVVSFLQFLKAFALIPTTLYVIPSTLTVLGMVMDFALELAWLKLTSAPALVITYLLPPTDNLVLVAGSASFGIVCDCFSPHFLHVKVFVPVLVYVGAKVILPESQE